MTKNEPVQKTNIIMQDVRSKPLTYVVQVATVVILILNLYLATKLQPITENIKVNAGHIQELKNDIVGKTLFLSELKDLDARLDRMENKLDRLLEN